MTATATAATTSPRERRHGTRSFRVGRRTTNRADDGTRANLRDIRAHESRGPGNGLPLLDQSRGASAPASLDSALTERRDTLAAEIEQIAERAATLPPARAWAAGIYSDQERLERCRDTAVNLWLAGEELDPWRVAKRVRNQANRGQERERLTRSVPLAIDDATGLVDTSVADSLNERPGRARPRRRARHRSVWTSISEQEERTAVRAAMGKLSANHQRVLWQMAGGLKQETIAERRGVTQHAVSQLWDRARGAFLPGYFDALGLPLPTEPTRPRRRRRIA
jgi:hypothetical protein